VEVAGETVVLPSWEEAERTGAPVPDAERFAEGEAGANLLERQIPALPGGRRHILVLGGFAGDRAERLLLSWATVAGAALLLEPEPAHLVPTAVWARPTLFAGTAADLARLRAAVEEDEAGFKLFKRRRRLPFGRLRSVLGTEGELSVEARAFWEERGVGVRGI